MLTKVITVNTLLKTFLYIFKHLTCSKIYAYGKNISFLAFISCDETKWVLLLESNECAKLKSSILGEIFFVKFSLQKYTICKSNLTLKKLAAEKHRWKKTIF